MGSYKHFYLASRKEYYVIDRLPSANVFRPNTGNSELKKHIIAFILDLGKLFDTLIANGD